MRSLKLLIVPHLHLHNHAVVITASMTPVHCGAAEQAYFAFAAKKEYGGMEAPNMPQLLLHSIADARVVVAHHRANYEDSSNGATRGMKLKHSSAAFAWYRLCQHGLRPPGAESADGNKGGMRRWKLLIMPHLHVHNIAVVTTASRTPVRTDLKTSLAQGWPNT